MSPVKSVGDRGPRRRRARGLAMLGLLLVLTGFPATAARADSPTNFGWWSRENPGGYGLLPVAVSPPNVPPDIPTGGFEVTGSSDEVVSYAAIGYYTFG